MLKLLKKLLKPFTLSRDELVRISQENSDELQKTYFLVEMERCRRDGDEYGVRNCENQLKKLEG